MEDIKSIIFSGLSVVPKLLFLKKFTIPINYSKLKLDCGIAFFDSISFREFNLPYGYHGGIIKAFLRRIYIPKNVTIIDHLSYVPKLNGVEILKLNINNTKKLHIPVSVKQLYLKSNTDEINLRELELQYLYIGVLPIKYDIPNIPTLKTIEVRIDDYPRPKPFSKIEHRIISAKCHYTDEDDPYEQKLIMTIILK
jgi:hypothetical protein